MIDTLRLKAAEAVSEAVAEELLLAVRRRDWDAIRRHHNALHHQVDVEREKLDNIRKTCANHRWRKIGEVEKFYGSATQTHHECRMCGTRRWFDSGD